MSMKEDVKFVAADGTSSVEDFYWFCISITFDNHFSSERIGFVGSNEGVHGGYFVSVGGYAVCVLAAAFFAGAVC